jgi:glucose/arabinose dehydrogenase
MHLTWASLAILARAATAQTTTSSAAPASCAAPAAPSVAPGFRVQLAAANLERPRSLLFDAAGALLVVEQRQGIRRLSVREEGGCVKAQALERVVSDASVGCACSLTFKSCHV